MEGKTVNEWSKGIGSVVEYENDEQVVKGIGYVKGKYLNIIQGQCC